MTVATDKGGNVTVNDDGSFSYTPFQSLAAGETDTDTFSYVATNGAGGTLASTVTITLTGENDPPNAMDDGPYMTDEDTALVGVRTNLALAGTATQSSSRIGSGCNDAPCAIDGNTDGNFNNNSVTHTQNQSFTWWQVELPQVSNIDDIVLYNRTDCCGNRLSQFRVSIFDGDPDAGGTETFFFNHPGTAGATVSIDVDAVSPNARGNYVRVAIDPASAAGDAGMNGDGLNSQGGTLSLAEVEVFGTLLHNDTDPDTTDVLSVVAFDATSTNGASVNVSSDGTFDYDPTGSATLQALDEGQALTDTFTYTISDGLTPANGRFIMVQNNGPVNRRLDIGEIEAFAPGVVPAVGNAGGSGSLNPTTDLATAGMGASVHSRGATSSFSKSHGADSELIDGAEETGANTWGASGVGTFVIIDLGQNRDVATVRIHQRNDGCCQDRLMDFTVSLLADSGGSPGAVVQSAVFATQPANNSFGQLIMAEIPSGALDTATVSVQVTGVNDAPVAVADANSVTESADAVVNPQATGNVLTNDADVDDPNSSFTVTAVNGMGGNVGNTVAGTYGSVVISTDGSYTYTLADADPDTQALQEGQVVTETFAYVMNDNHSSGNAMNASSTLTITVTGSNDSPVATDNTAAVQEDTTLTDAGNVISDDDGNGVDSDVDNAMLTVTDIGGTADPNVDVAGTYGSLDWDTDGSYTYTLNNAAANVQSLAQGQTVTDTFTYTVNDSAVTPASGRFIRVRNNGPANRLLHIGEIEVFEPGVAPAANFDSANDLALTSKGATVESTVGTGGHGNAQDTIDGLEQSGAAVWTRQAVAAEIVIDLGASFQIERVRVHQRNDSCCQDRLMDFTVSLLADDGAGNPGAVVQSAVFSGQPSTNSFGQVTLAPISVAATDTAMLAVSVQGVNDAPVVNAGNDQVVNEGDSVMLDPATFTDVDTNDSHTATINWGDGSPTEPGAVNQSSGEVSGSHVYGDNGSYTVTVCVDDGMVEVCDTLTATVNNVPPVGVDDMYTTTEDAVLMATAIGAPAAVLANDTDVGTLDTHTVTEVNGSTQTNMTGDLIGTSEYGAKIVMQADGSFSYDPRSAAALQVLSSGESVTDHFTYTIQDDDGGADTATVEIVVTSMDAIEVNTNHEFVFQPVSPAPGVTAPITPGGNGGTDSVQFDLTGGNWEIRVNSSLLRTTSATSAPIEVTGSTDGDNVVFNGLGTGSITVAGGTGGGNSLTLDDSADDSSDDVVADGTTLTELIDGGAIVTHGNVQTLSVSLGSEPDSFDANAISSGQVTSLTVAGNGGVDTFDVTTNTQTSVHIDGGAPTAACGVLPIAGDILNVTTVSIDLPFIFPATFGTASNPGDFPTSVSGAPNAPITWTSLESFFVDGQSFAACDIFVRGTTGSDRMIFSVGSGSTLLVRINDVFYGPYAIPGTIEVEGGGGQDEIVAGNNLPNAMDARGDAGDDYIALTRNDDTADGGLGDDTIIGGGGNDTISGDDGDDHLEGGAGDDVISGGNGRDYIVGRLGNDTISGDAGADNIAGEEGDDLIHGGSGDDTLQGGTGNDVVVGGDGSDLVFGNPGDGPGNGDRDILIGGPGADGLFGRGDDDILVGSGTDHDSDFTALAALLSEWTSSNDFATRRGNIAAGVPVGMSTVALNASSINPDGVRDVLTGGLGADWYLASGEDDITRLSGEDAATFI